MYLYCTEQHTALDLDERSEELPALMVWCDVVAKSEVGNKRRNRTFFVSVSERSPKRYFTTDILIENTLLPGGPGYESVSFREN